MLTGIFSSRLAVAMIASGTALAGAASASCVVLYNSHCCSTLSLNLTRKCGLANDQDCPDSVDSNPPVVLSSVTLTGNHPGANGSSVLCLYKTGRCRGSLGPNLCEYSEQKQHGCTNQTAGAAGCTTMVPVPR